jgi:crotonobetainyl-CoA:carnitine CoA-transferase CaiB-like acyl-CoA transferase
MIVGDFRTIWRLLVKVHGVLDPTPADSDLETKIRLRREAVARFFGSFGERKELIAALDLMNLAWGELRSSVDAFQSPTAKARGSLAEVDDRNAGTRPIVQSPYRFSDAQSGVRGGAAYRGEHNHVVLTRWLDASADEIRQLALDGILGEEPRP